MTKGKRCALTPQRAAKKATGGKSSPAMQESSASREPNESPSPVSSLPLKAGNKKAGKKGGSRGKKSDDGVGFQQQILNVKGIVEPGTTSKGPKNVHHCPFRNGKSHSVKADCIQSGHCAWCDMHPGRYRHPKQPCPGCVAEEQARNRASSTASPSARSASTGSGGSGSESRSNKGSARSGQSGKGLRKKGK